MNALGFALMASMTVVAVVRLRFAHAVFAKHQAKAAENLLLQKPVRYKRHLQPIAALVLLERGALLATVTSNPWLAPWSSHPRRALGQWMDIVRVPTPQNLRALRLCGVSCHPRGKFEHQRR